MRQNVIGRKPRTAVPAPATWPCGALGKTTFTEVPLAKRELPHSSRSARFRQIWDPASACVNCSTAHSSRSACTKAWGRLPRSWRWETSNSSEYKAGGPAGGAVALEPAGGVDVVALLGMGQGHPESAQQERSFGLSQRPLVGPVAVAVSILRELGLDRLQGREGARVRRRDRTADGGQQQRGIDASISGRALPAPRACEVRARRCGRRTVGERDPASGLLATGSALGDLRAVRRRKSSGCGSMRRDRAPRCRRRCPAPASAVRSRRRPPRRRASRRRRGDRGRRRRTNSSSASPRASS